MKLYKNMYLIRMPLFKFEAITISESAGESSTSKKKVRTKRRSVNKSVKKTGPGVDSDSDSDETEFTKRKCRNFQIAIECMKYLTFTHERYVIYIY